jgi:hypothetical protein
MQIKFKHNKENKMTPSEMQAIRTMQAQQAQRQQDTNGQNGFANGGLGTPPQQFEYQQNPSIDLMKAHVALQQQQLAQQAAQQNQQRGYAGYQSDQTAGIATGNPVSGSNGQEDGASQQHPNAGWSPSSPEAHQLNIQLADRIKTGTIDPKTAMLAVQSPEVSPEIKQALVAIIQQAQQAQQGGQIGQPMPQQGGQGLNPSGPIPQPDQQPPQQ